MTDSEKILQAMQVAQLILADYVEPGPRDSDKTINELLFVLDRNDLVEAVDRLEAGLGLRLPN
jgi:hypothetical protein